jgi:pimeloyl-ACP methyl ester carboxylesterase
MDGYADTGSACSDFRGSIIVPNAGHWLQQEAPDETNKAIEGFLQQL